MPNPILNIQHFSKTYSNNKKAVDDLSLTVMPGDIYGFIGHNGAGKTTTIRAVVGVLDFSLGEIEIDGMSVKKQPVACKAVTAYLPDNPDLYDFLTGIQYLAFIADIYGVGKHEREQRIAQFGELFGLTPSLGDLVSSYSHGMKQKLALISAFLRAPKLMVLDEPFVGLDPQASFRLKGAMAEHCKAGGAIFFSTHVLEVAEKLCNKIAIIKGGKLVADGDAETVMGDSSLEQVFMEVVEHDS